MDNTSRRCRVLVSGAASGIGRSCAEQLAAVTADVVLDSDAEGATGTVSIPGASYEMAGGWTAT